MRRLDCRVSFSLHYGTFCLSRRRSRDAENSWRSKSETWIFIRMAPVRRSFGVAKRMRRGRGGNPGSIAPIFKRVAQRIGTHERFVDPVSGHSTRVGATQDLAALEIDLAAITQAGGWKSTRMPLQYAEKINATRSGMARAAEKSGRDSTVLKE
jgi:hypothetical protein